MRCLRAVLLFLALPPAIPAPRDHSFWATARENFGRKQWQKRNGRAWKPGVPFYQGDLTHRGADVHGALSQWDATDGRGVLVSPSDSLARKLGHSKEDESASNSWSVPRFGPSMLLSGEAALRNRPAPDPEEEDRLNAVRQRQVYLGQSLAPEEFAHNVHKLKAQFDRSHIRPGAEGPDDETVCDRNELFQSMVSWRLSHRPGDTDSGRSSSFSWAGAKAKHGPSGWHAEDVRQEAIAEKMWSQTSASPHAEGEGDAKAAASEQRQSLKRCEDTPCTKNPGKDCSRVFGSKEGLVVSWEDRDRDCTRLLSAQPQEQDSYPQPCHLTNPSHSSDARRRTAITPAQAFAHLRQRKARGAQASIRPPFPVRPSAASHFLSSSLCKNQTSLPLSARKKDSGSGARLDDAVLGDVDGGKEAEGGADPSGRLRRRHLKPKHTPGGEVSNPLVPSERSCPIGDGTISRATCSREEQVEAPVQADGVCKLRAWIAARYGDGVMRKQATCSPTGDMRGARAQVDTGRGQGQGRHCSPNATCCPAGDSSRLESAPACPGSCLDNLPKEHEAPGRRQRTSGGGQASHPRPQQQQTDGRSFQRPDDDTMNDAEANGREREEQGLHAGWRREGEGASRLTAQRQYVQGFPGKARILGMRRQELEALVHRFPAILSPCQARLERSERCSLPLSTLTTCTSPALLLPGAEDRPRT